MLWQKTKHSRFFVVISIFICTFAHVFNTQIYDEEKFIFHYGIYRCLLAMCH